MSTSNTLATDFTIQLHDGRTLGVASVGPSDGFPIFHSHGSGSSRLEVNLLAAAASDQGVRLIGLDRPGIGRSDPKTGYQLLDWPDDVIEVANQLGIERFALQGISAGGAYALACAYKIPDRLTACGLISALPPSSFIKSAGPRWMRAVWWMGAHLPWLLRPYVRLVQRMTGSQDHIAPVVLARKLTQALPHCTAIFYPDEGHFSTAANHAQDILHTLSTK